MELSGTSYIRRFTAEVSALVAAEHADDPMGELLVWLQMALRREASVGEIYGVTNLERRLEQVRGRTEIVTLLRLTICNIWAQEKAHAAYLEAVLAAVARPAPTLWGRLASRLDGFMGAVEGHIMSGKTSPSQVQRAKASLMLALGRQVQDVPEFVSSLSALSFREFCLLNAELEITAVRGYERMLVLLGEVAAESSLPRVTTLAIDIERMIRDERFHNEAFRAIEGWFGPPRARYPESHTGNTLRASVSLEACEARFAAIRERVYRAAAAEPTPASPRDAAMEDRLRPPRSSA